MTELTDRLEPVYDEKKELSWLTVRYTKSSSIGTSKPVKEILEKNIPLTEKPVFSLMAQGYWHCQKCGALIKSVPEAPTECYGEQGGCGRQTSFKPYTKIINPDFWKIPTWTDIPDTTDIYQELFDINKKCIIFVEDIQYKIYTLSIISSYFMDQWETIAYLAFIGLIESGKSRALDIIAETGWRMMNAGSGISFPAMVRGTHLYGAGVLIDEAHDKLTSTKKQGYSEKCQEMIDFIKPGYRKGSHYIIADKENPEKIISYNNFGFKAFAGEREFDRATMSRCIVFQMEQDYPEIQNLREIRNKFDLLQTKLLNLKYKRNTPIPEIPQDIGINGRNLEIFSPIIRTAMYLGIDYQDIVEYAKQRKEEEVESFRNSDEYDVLKAIKGEEENERLFDAPEEISYAELIEKLRWVKTDDQNPNQKLGYILGKKLFLKTKRKTEGTVLLLTDPKNDRKLKYLYKRYKV